MRLIKLLSIASVCVLLVMCVAQPANARGGGGGHGGGGHSSGGFRSYSAPRSASYSSARTYAPRTSTTNVTHTTVVHNHGSYGGGGGGFVSGMVGGMVGASLMNHPAVVVAGNGGYVQGGGYNGGVIADPVQGSVAVGTAYGMGYSMLNTLLAFVGVLFCILLLLMVIKWMFPHD